MQRYIYSIEGYDSGNFAPGLKRPGTGPYLCTHHMLKAHAVSYEIYNKDFRAKQNGKVGIAADCWWYEPADPTNPDHCKAALRALEFRVNRLVYMVFYSFQNKCFKPS